MKMALACIVGIALIVGFGEGFDWVIPLFAILVGGAAMVLIVGSMSSSALPTFHAHGDTRARTVTHEKRHKRVLLGLGIKVGGFLSDGIKVWENPDWGWEGETVINKSAANLARWEALSPEEQAAVYIAGSPSLGRNNNDFGCSDDFANVDARAPRDAARRIAQEHLGWFS